MKEMREKATVLENFYNNLTITNVLSRDDVISLEDALSSNIITSTKDIKTFSFSKTYINVEDVKELLKEEIKRNKLASTITQEQLFDKANSIIDKINNWVFEEVLAGTRVNEEHREKVLKFLKDDRYFLRYESNDGVDELINIKSKGIFEIMIRYPEVVEELAKLQDNTDVYLDNIANIINNLNRHINNGENILEIDVSKLNFVSDAIFSNFMNKDNTTVLSWLERNTTSYFMDMHNVITLIENIGYGTEKVNSLIKFIESIGEYDNKRTQQDIIQLSDFLDTVDGHMNNPHFYALYKFLSYTIHNTKTN